MYTSYKPLWYIVHINIEVWKISYNQVKRQTYFYNITNKINNNMIILIYSTTSVFSIIFQLLTKQSHIT